MSEYLYDSPKLVVKHLPDFSMEIDSDGNKERTPLPGQVQVGVLLDGAFIPITGPMNKGTVDSQIKAAQDAAEKNPPKGKRGSSAQGSDTDS